MRARRTAPLRWLACATLGFAASALAAQPPGDPAGAAPAPPPVAPAAEPTTPPPPALAAAFGWTVETRLRGEAFTTPVVSRHDEDRYELGLVRLRAGADWQRGGLALHGVLQGAAAAGLPARAVLGAGAAYRTASGDEGEVASLAVLEATAAYRTAEVVLVVGRQPWADGAETMTGVAYLDGVKRARLSERLVGNWDWTNVGRRFDGASAAWQGEVLHVAAIAFRPTAGGVDHDDALEALDDLRLLGLTATARYGRWLPGGEARLFLYAYDDERRGARTAAGGAIDLLTGGGHLLVGGEDWDAFVWAALQRGDWGRHDHRASGLVIETGRQLRDLPGTPALRVGLARASGDEAGGDHTAFLPLLPTMHKFLGAMDLFTFANLETAYLEGRWQLPASWTLAAGLHTFRLAERDDAWYGGSGAFDEARLGYTLRRPAGGGAYPSRHLGEELDLELARPLAHGLALAVGVSWLHGGAAAEAAFLDGDGDATWGWLQLTWRGGR